MSGRAKRLTLEVGACQSERQELELARSLCDSGSIANVVRTLHVLVVIDAPQQQMKR
jgi:hypothetical protein